MKTTHLRPALAGIALGCAASLAMASDTTTGSDVASVRVTATVSDVCKFTSVPALAFPAINPSQASNVPQAAALKYKCTKDTNAQFDVNGKTDGSYQGTLTHTAQASKTLGYTLTWGGVQPKGAGFGPAGELTFNLMGLITAAQHQDASAGSYEGTVLVTIAP
jgi:spore coat protein U-like protein